MEYVNVHLNKLYKFAYVRNKNKSLKGTLDLEIVKTHFKQLMAININLIEFIYTSLKMNY